MKRPDPGRTFALLIVLLLGAVLVGLATAPARYADAALAHATQGRVRLAQVEGTIWNGSAQLVLTRGEAGGAIGPAFTDRSPGDALLSGVAIPGRIVWSIRALPLLVAQLDAQLRIGSLAQPVRVHGNWSEVRIDAGTIELPSVELGQLGSPWNTVRPAGALRLSWENLRLRAAGLDGRAHIELHNASSAMTPVRPLGSYRVEVVGHGRRAELGITTIDGPLRLQGNGSFDTNRGLRFVAEASAEARERDRLQSFLGLIGPREGEHTIIRIGT